MPDPCDIAKAMPNQKPDRKTIAPTVRHSNAVPESTNTIKMAKTTKVEMPITHAKGPAQGIRRNNPTAART
jgi:hypothetical protein